MSRKIAYPVVLILTAALALLVLSGCGSQSEESTEGAQSAATQPAAAPGSKGSTAPDFTLKRLDGSQLQLSSLRGKVVVIDFWDTWCPPCKAAMPHFQALSEQYADDVVVVGVALGREGEEKVRKFATDYGITFEMVMFNNDPALIQAFGGIQSIPTTFLVDADGVIREKWIGGHGKAVYEQGIKSLLGT